MSESITSPVAVKRSPIQWSYLLASSVIILTLMLVVGFLNIRNLEEDYRKSFFESSQAVSKGSLQTIEYGLKYGKTIASFYTALPIITEIHDYISSSENVSIIDLDGTVQFSVFPKKVLSPTEFKALLEKLDKDVLLKTGAQTILVGGIHHELMPIRGMDGKVSAYLEVTFDDAVLRSKTSSFTQSSGLAVLVLTILGTVVLVITLARVPTTNEKGEVRRTMLMTIMIINITVCQLIFIVFNLWTYRNMLESNATENSRFVGEIIKKNIATVISKKLAFDELDDIQPWMASVVSSAPDIKGAVVTIGNGKTSYSSAPGLAVGAGSNPSTLIVLALKPDRSNTEATLTMVLDRDKLLKKLVPMCLWSLIILLGSIVALVQVTFVMIFVLNRRALANLKDYNDKLEREVEERTREIAREKAKSDMLLLNILPPKVAEELKEKGFSQPEAFENVSVFFSDVVGFTTLSSGLEAKHLIEELSDIFTNFDRIIERHSCQRIKTIGDAYLCVSGMPVTDPLHAHKLVNAALDIIDYLHVRNRNSVLKWQIRVGINSGPVVAGIVGVQKYLYDVFGDTVNIASRMESNSEPMRINVSDRTWALIKDDFRTTPRGYFDVKGKGSMQMHFIDRLVV